MMMYVSGQRKGNFHKKFILDLLVFLTGLIIDIITYFVLFQVFESFFSKP